MLPVVETRGGVRPFTQATLMVLVLALSLASFPTVSQATTRHWTLRDIVTAPEIMEIKLSADLRLAAYLVKQANLETDRDETSLWVVELDTKNATRLVTAHSIAQVQSTNEKGVWTALIDQGDGVQLFKVGPNSTVHPLLSHHPLVETGYVDGGIRPALFQAPQKIGIWSYSVSPDGKWIWYAILRDRTDRKAPFVDDQVLALRNRVRRPTGVTVEYRLRGPDQSDIKLAQRPLNDLWATYYGGGVSWSPTSLQYLVAGNDEDNAFSVRVIERDLATGNTQIVRRDPDYGQSRNPVGPLGGIISTTGLGETRELAEILGNGKAHSYGKVKFSLNQDRGVNSWRSRDGKKAIISFRGFEDMRYGLAVIGRDGLRKIVYDKSLTQCDFSPDLRTGICVSEAQNSPPRLVRVSNGKIISPLVTLCCHEEIEPLKITTKIWKNRWGYTASGNIVWPRAYVPGKRYPAIIVTHGSDADQRFVEPALQWNYPVQYWAERGFVVILVNDPSPRQSPELSAAYDAWASGKGPPEPSEVQRLIWRNGVVMYEDIIQQLAEKGIVDADRVGIAGYSRGSQMVNVAMSQSNVFKAGSSGDGGYLEPVGYWQEPQSYAAIYGGAPYGGNLQLYRSLAPSLRAREICGAILQQMAAPIDAAMEFHQALRSQGLPSQISLYPGETYAANETHIFHIPSNRIAAMEENVAWFDYWLSGKSDQLSDVQHTKWTALDRQRPARCRHVAPR